jgi:hypothetical protein
MKSIKKFPLSVLCTFYKQKVSIMLQCVQALSILKRVVAIGEGFF